MYAVPSLPRYTPQPKEETPASRPQKHAAGRPPPAGSRAEPMAKAAARHAMTRLTAMFPLSDRNWCSSSPPLMVAS
nr:unnamed protein product [Digitaria exilis]